MPLTLPANHQTNLNNTRGFLFPLILVTSLFFLWGLAYGLLDVLNKHFQEALNITKQRSTLLQAAYFGAYFLMAIPAGQFMTKAGYKKGIIFGLILYALGAFLFFPSASAGSFPFFLVSLFILASGLTFLETAANPYITVLGSAKGAAFRLNLSQSFNGIGSFIGPIIGAQLFFQSGTGSSDLTSVKFVYLFIGSIVLLVAIVFYVTKLPEVQNESTENFPDEGPTNRLFSYPHFKAAVVAQFFYVAAQVGMAALFINYCTEKNLGITNENASYMLSASLLLFTTGRFVGTGLLKFMRPQNLLSLYAGISMALCLIVSFVPGMFGVYALISIFFFASIMFPTIFALGIRDLGPQTKRASSFIIMAIVGGALVPSIMGAFELTATAYIVPLICFGVVLWFGLRGYKMNK